MTANNYTPGGSNPRGGLDRYLGPSSASKSSMPESQVDGRVETDAPEDNDRSHEAAADSTEAAQRIEQMQHLHRPDQP